MFEPIGGFSGFSVRSARATRQFYRDVLGLDVRPHGYGTFVTLPGGNTVFFYPKGARHRPADFTILNLVVPDIDAAVDALASRGVEFEHYPYTDAKGIQRGLASGRGPDQAWFTDPSGNILSVLVDDAGGDGSR